MPNFAIAAHGGAGTISPADMTPEREHAYRVALEQSVNAGHAVLARGGSSLDAVTAAVLVLEDSPLFNAGKGAVFNAEGEHELDAAIMDGASRKAGAVAGLQRARNPILVARAVMEKTSHVMLSGAGAEAFAESQGLEIVSPDYFYTEGRWNALKKMQERLRQGGAGAVSDEDKHGTVGAVALDQAGNVAAATSTGGHTHKMVGRVGDGEFFIRLCLSHEIASRMRYRGESLQQAAEHVVMKELTAMGGTGGLLAIDARGNISMPFNTAGMYRAAKDAQGRVLVAIHRA
jgi:beta-aspartyl-peptidase (threonine type)